RSDCYGYEIVNRISDCMQITEGTVYPLLKRLKDNMMIDSYIVESQEGPPRKYYAITDRGREVKTQQEEEWNSFSSAINKLLKGDEV
ncbi:MAG: PadR family transcriptional regulator, partial [Ruminiclostridium sp.]|nr:PadR family transcriptional regulator [Ruminiclostridium sp.]